MQTGENRHIALDSNYGQPEVSSTADKEALSLDMAEIKDVIAQELGPDNDKIEKVLAIIAKYSKLEISAAEIYFSRLDNLDSFTEREKEDTLYKVAKSLDLAKEALINVKQLINGYTKEIIFVADIVVYRLLKAKKSVKTLESSIRHPSARSVRTPKNQEVSLGTSKESLTARIVKWLGLFKKRSIK